MKNQFLVPTILGVAALITAYPAWMPERARAAATQAEGSDVFGKPASADVIADLRVAEWDESTASQKIFEVKRSGNEWIIPSHFDFPADANPRVSEASAKFLGLKKGRLVSADPKQYPDLGVVDPLDQNPAQKTGRGKRITMTDITGQPVVDLIVGKRVEQGEGVYYLREASAKEVYTAKVDPDLSTKFVDYVEADPLKIKREDVRALTVADYSVDAAQGKVDVRSETPITRGENTEVWTATGPVPPDKRLAQGTASGILNALTSMKLVGVRPFDPSWLQDRGFFFAQPGTVDSSAPMVQTQKGAAAVVGNEGRLGITTKNGLRYSLMFGEVALDEEADTTADKKKAEEAEKAEKKDDAKKDDKKPDDAKSGHNRYMVVFVQYDPAFDEDAKKPEPAPKEGEPKKDTKKKSGKELAAKEQQRFLKFFYVISDDSFKQLRPGIDKLFEAKPPEPMAGKTGKTNSEWLADNAKRPEVKTTASGLQYEVLSEGPAGGKKPAATDRVQVRYKGTLVDGTEFDASKDAPAEFGVTGVIKGWTEALQLMKEGDKLKLYIKPELGYGEAGSPPKIPANSILIFEVELVKVLGEGQPQAAVPAPVPAAAKPTAAAKPVEAAKPTDTPPAPAPAAPAQPAPAK